MGKDVRVRIAPSPTGFAHVGTAYAALFNYAFAKKHSGKFILRLEDTDIKRNVAGAEKAIYESLAWLGLTWDEGQDKGGKYGPYRQSKKLKIYQKKAEELILSGFAYKDEGAVRFKSVGEDVSWEDLIRGNISFPGGEVGDFVILKSNGYPTYNFSVVIDDFEMKISHVIRGEEHISNTPRQIALYKALGLNAPKFAHFPDLRNEKRQKLSKRRDPVDLRSFREKGYLPESLVNFLCLLGWSHPKEKEIFDLNEFVKFFSLERVRKAGPIFNLRKLDWMNGQYIQNSKSSKLQKEIYKFFKGKYSKDKIKEILPLVKTRIKTLNEFETFAGFFFKRPKVSKDLFGKSWKRHLKVALVVLSAIEPFDNLTMSEQLQKAVSDNSFKIGDFFMDLRVATTGSRTTPPINESIVILGKKETLIRLKSILS